MSTIIGVDAALANTGLNIWRDGYMNVTTIHTEPGFPPETRWRRIGAHLWQIVDDETLVVLEGVFVNDKVPGTSIDLAMLHGTLRIGLHYRRVPFVVVDNGAVKQYACGVGRASKREMVAATSRLRLPFAMGDDHQADATWLVAMALDHYGHPMCDTSAAGRKALARQAWPKLPDLLPPPTRIGALV